jgi:hypothetical protein
VDLYVAPKAHPAPGGAFAPPAVRTVKNGDGTGFEAAFVQATLAFVLRFGGWQQANHETFPIL